MKIKHILLLISLIAVQHIVYSQSSDANVFGDVKAKGVHVPFANVFIQGTTIGTTTDETGHYMLVNLPVGDHILVARSLGYKESVIEITAEQGKTIEINFELEEDPFTFNEVVVTGTKTFKRQTDSPVIVGILDANLISSVQACNISEGLRFQPGLRVETDCQTCNYTQLRMNGLGGGYSQILINGRPIFSPLMGLYGMEQIPANMLERIEIVRGGGSALYGSSAIGGTVNIITRIPDRNDYSLSSTTHSINGEALDQVLSGNISMVNRKGNAGAVLYVNRRFRDAYDHPGITLNSDGSSVIEKDNYSELPLMRNNSFGGSLFYQPTIDQKIELSFTSLNEYRYGGEIIEQKAHLAQQSEERVHNIFMGSADYQINFNNDNSSFITYFAGQYTDRDHYTGLFPIRNEFGSDQEFDVALLQHLNNPPYGYTYNTTLQGGVQMNHRFNDFVGAGTNVFTIGTEYLYDDVLDSIPQYGYGTVQQTSNAAAFLQSDWSLNQNFTFLAGLRADKHNMVENIIVSPRISFLYKIKELTQFRITYGTGFRAPQAFDSDMHVAFAGGGVSRISLASGLKEERSNSVSGSMNYDHPTEKYIFGFTLEGFYTKLNDAFFLQPVGSDGLGELFEKRNGPGAKVQGLTLELRGNYNKTAQIEAGYTLSQSVHDEAIDYIDGLDPKKEFLRTPNHYGYALVTLNPTPKWTASINTVYTGSMIHAKFSPDEALTPNEFRTTDPFIEISAKLGYTFNITTMDTGLEVYVGVRNITNVYQTDFDNFRNRDSNYIYGPATPRTFYVGLKLMSL